MPKLTVKPIRKRLGTGCNVAVKKMRLNQAAEKGFFGSAVKETTKRRELANSCFKLPETLKKF